MQAKNLLLGTGLAQQTLAGVWNLADIDKDGLYHVFAFQDENQVALIEFNLDFSQAS